MADQVLKEDDQNLWRAVYTAEKGWTRGVVFADHLSIAAPALAEVGGTLYCAHRGERRAGQQQLPLRWTSFTPAALLPLAAALEKAGAALPEGASDEEKLKRQEKITAAAAALDSARKWTPDEQVSWVLSGETPALVNDNGTLRMVFTQVDGTGYSPVSSDREIQATSLWETELEQVDGKPEWSRPRRIETRTDLPLAPALAVFNGAVHLVHADPSNEYLHHLVRGSDGTWTWGANADALKAYDAAWDAWWESERKVRTGAREPKPPMPDRGENPDGTPGRIAYSIRPSGWPGNASLAVHEGRLHLLVRKTPNDTLLHHESQRPGGYLLHQVFDGRDWTALPAPGESEADWDAGLLTASRRGAALASYGGKLHAVYPAVEGDKLVHATWAKDGGWASPVTLEGHDSNNTPALLTFKEGPAGAEREALLLVHRGIDRYVPPTPPAPPAPPTLADVKEYGKTVTGEGATTYAAGAWSRVRHRLSLTPVTLEDDSKGVIATWEAKADYYWGTSWYPESGGSDRPFISSGTLWLRKGRLDTPHTSDFSGKFDSSGYFRHDALIAGLNAGTYELFIGGLTSRNAATGTRAPPTDPKPTSGPASTTSAPPPSPTRSDPRQTRTHARPAPQPGGPHWPLRRRVRASPCAQGPGA